VKVCSKTHVLPVLFSEHSVGKTFLFCMQISWKAMLEAKNVHVYSVCCYKLYLQPVRTADSGKEYSICILQYNCWSVHMRKPLLSKLLNSTAMMWLTNCQ